MFQLRNIRYRMGFSVVKETIWYTIEKLSQKLVKRSVQHTIQVVYVVAVGEDE